MDQEHLEPAFLRAAVHQQSRAFLGHAPSVVARPHPGRDGRDAVRRRATSPGGCRELAPGRRVWASTDGWGRVAAMRVDLFDFDLPAGADRPAAGAAAGCGPTSGGSRSGARGPSRPRSSGSAAAGRSAGAQRHPGDPGQARRPARRRDGRGHPASAGRCRRGDRWRCRGAGVRLGAPRSGGRSHGRRADVGVGDWLAFGRGLRRRGPGERRGGRDHAWLRLPPGSAARAARDLRADAVAALHQAPAPGRPAGPRPTIRPCSPRAGAPSPRRPRRCIHPCA